MTASRMHDGPEPGTYVVCVEFPPDTDLDLIYKVETALGNVAKHVIPGTYIHGHRVMESKGKHGFVKESTS